MQTWMIVVAVVVVALPWVLMLAFQRRDVADARGRRVEHAWRVDQQKI